MNLLLSPHDDDNALFASFICLREHPLVVIVTDSYIQSQRGELGCESNIRADETREAAKILGCPVIRLGIRDDVVTEEAVVKALRRLQGFDTVYAPALQGGNYHHDIVSRAAAEAFSRVQYYTTYSKEALYTKGGIEVRPTEEEANLKYKALECYQSQLLLPATRPHFEAVINRSEWICTRPDCVK